MVDEEYFKSLVRKPVKKKRKCLRCNNSFTSANAGIRVCLECSAKNSRFANVVMYQVHL